MRTAMNTYRQEIKHYLLKQFNLPPEQVEELLPPLITALSEHIDNLETALGSNDPLLLGRAAHTIKGALLNLGLQECADIACSVERSGKAGQKDANYQELVQSIREKLDRYIK